MKPTPARRWFTLGCLYLLGGLLGYLALTHPPQSIYWLVFIVAAAASVFFLANAVAKATRTSIVLREDGVFTGEGMCICPMDEIRSVERGPFAFKPSGGFLLKTRSRQQRGWAPGMWWRFGKSIGVGGSTGATEGKIMAEIISDLITKKPEQS